MNLVNGKRQHSIAISDRGLQYGDGLFETIEVKNTRPVFFKRHLNRLKADCNRLKIPFPDPALLNDEIHSIIRDCSSAVVKVIISRGSGGRGYQQPIEIEPTRIISLHPYPEYPLSYQKQGINLRFCQHRLGINPALAGIKHLNRLDQVLARSEWLDNSIQEGLMLDNNNHVVEGTMSNLFLVKDNVLYTPPLNMCGIKGIIRQIILEIAEKHKINLMERTINKVDILSADELFVTNSIIGIWPVKSLQDKSYVIGSFSQKFNSWLNECKQQDLCA